MEKLLASVGKLLTQLQRFPVALLLIGVIVGVSIGWFLGVRSRIDTIPIPPAKATTYTEFSNQDLKHKAARLVLQIRALARSYYDEDNRMRTAADGDSAKTDSQAERARIRKRWIDDSAKLHDGFLDRYKTDYWADAILLREAMVAKVGGAPGAQNPILFQHPTNMLGVEQVANSLELLGKSLPEK